MSAEAPPDRDQGQGRAGSNSGPLDKREIPWFFNLAIFVTFGWITFGLAFIYGIRLWWDTPLDPSFIPFLCVGFGVVVAFAIVLTLSNASGDIEFEAPGFTFKGASGPIVLWVVCFLAVMFGFYMVGVAEVFKRPAHSPVPIQDLGRGAGPVPPTPTAPPAIPDR